MARQTDSHEEALADVQKEHQSKLEDSERGWRERLSKVEAQASARNAELEKEWMSKLASLQEELQTKAEADQARATVSQQEREALQFEAREKATNDMKVRAFCRFFSAVSVQVALFYCLS